MRSIILVLAALIVAAAGGHTERVVAAETSQTEPMLVVAISSYDRWAEDGELLGELSGNPDLTTGVRSMVMLFTNNRGLVGLDKKRRSGIVLQANGTKITGYAFLPVTNLPKLLDTATPFLGQIRDLGDGVFRVRNSRFTVYIRERGRWAFVSADPKSPAVLPDDPSTLLVGLDRDYGLAIRVAIRSIPAEHREEFLAKLGQAIRARFVPDISKGTDQFLIRGMLTEGALAMLASAVDELEHVTLGWSLRRDPPRVVLDLDVTAAEGTSAAELLGRLQNRTSAFTGFSDPESVFCGNWSAKCGPMDNPAQLDALLAAASTVGSRSIDDVFSDAAKAQVAKQFLIGLLSAARGNLVQGKIDGGMALTLTPDRATLVYGRFTAGEEDTRRVLEKFMASVRAGYPEVAAGALQSDIDRYEDIRFHRIAFDVPEGIGNHDRIVRLIGPQLQIVVGVAPRAVYLAAGRDALESLKRAIRRSEAESSRKVVPVALSVSLGKMAQFAAALGPASVQSQSQRALDLLKAAADENHARDRVRLSLLPIPSGVRLRLELESGVLRLFGQADSVE